MVDGGEVHCFSYSKPKAIKEEKKRKTNMDLK